MERMSFLLKRAYALLEDAIELGLTQLNISGREFAVLTLIESKAGVPTATRGPCRVDRTTMVALVDALEEKGWSTASGIPAIGAPTYFRPRKRPQETPRHSQGGKES